MGTRTNKCTTYFYSRHALKEDDRRALERQVARQLEQDVERPRLELWTRDGKGGGGTDFHPVFDLIAEGDEPPEVLLFLTDGFGPAPKNRPNYPVIWGVIEDGRQPANWGQMMEISRGS